MMEPLDVIGDPDLRATLLFARGRALPVTADEVAAAIGVHRNVARARLERLTEAGLLVFSFERRTNRTGPGAGRPAKTYRVAPELSALEFPARRYERLIRLIVEGLPERGRRERLRRAGVAFGRELARDARLRPAGSLRSAVGRICAGLGRLGYQADFVEVSDEQMLVTTPTCPLRPLVCEDAALAELDRGMWAGLVAAALEDVEATRIGCDTGASCRRRETDCRVLLTLAARSGPHA
jgi:predicted ArsR family transcriptional regulator